jgi:hypothetical protein
MLFEYLAGDADRAAAASLARRIAREEWSLFAGAGISALSGLPKASDLIQDIERALGFPELTIARDNLACPS